MIPLHCTPREKQTEYIRVLFAEFVSTPKINVHCLRSQTPPWNQRGKTQQCRVLQWIILYVPPEHIQLEPGRPTFTAQWIFFVFLPVRGVCRDADKLGQSHRGIGHILNLVILKSLSCRIPCRSVILIQAAVKPQRSSVFNYILQTFPALVSVTTENSNRNFSRCE